MCSALSGRFFILMILCCVHEASVYKSVHLMCNLACGVPQPRAFRVAEKLKIGESAAPYMAVLHRCDEGSGCCNGIGKICKVADFEMLNATIWVKINGMYKRQFIELRNHTRCSCQSFKDDPK